MSARQAAFEILSSRSSTPLREVEPAARAHELDARDARLLRMLVATEVRRRGSLRALVRHFARGKPDRELAVHLHLGLVQLFFLDQIPDHAAVAETVRGVQETLNPKKAHFANAVLRAALRARATGHCGDPRRDLVLRELHLTEPVFADPVEHPLLWAEDALSLPVALFRRWARRWSSERARELALGALEEQELSLRVTGTTERDALAAELEAVGVPTRPGLHPRILLARAADTERALHSVPFERGAFTVQGESACRAGELVGARPGEHVLDLCAAPGGKTALLAESGARVLACDVDERRLERVRETLARLALAERVELRVHDAQPLPGEGTFDAALVDVPCSNTGVLAKRPCARWRFEPAALRSLGEVQERLLARAARALRPGGRMVYATCSIEPEENERRIAAFLAREPDFGLEREIASLPDARGASGPVDGGYAALLVRR